MYIEMQLRSKFLSVIAIISILSFIGCSKQQTSKIHDTVDTISVMTDVVKTGKVKNIQSFSSIVDADVKNNISSQTGGRLEKLFVKVGDKVSKGQTIAILDQSQLLQIKVKLDDAKINFNRSDELYKIGGISKSQWEQAKNLLDITQQQYNNLRENTILTSPTEGVVSAKNYDVGDMTSVQIPVVVVEKISSVKVTLKISEKYYSMLKKDMPVDIVAEDVMSDVSFKGRIYNIYPTIDPNTHSVTVEVMVENKDLKLRPGMYVKATIDFGDSEETPVVPDMAVITQVGSGRKLLYKIENGCAVAQEVEIGQTEGDRCQVLSGVKSGDIIIVSNLNLLSTGTPVKVNKTDN